MRIAWIVIGALDQATGGYVYDRKVVLGLRRLGHEVELVSLERASALEGVSLLARLLASDFDVVVADELCHPAVAVAFAGLAALEASSSMAGRPLRRASPRRVLLVHHLAEWEDGASRASEWACLCLAHRVITTSVTSRERLRRSLGIDATACVPGVEHGVSAMRAASEKPPTLLFVGTVTPRKRLHVLIEALGALSRDDYRLIVVGDDRRDPEYTTLVTRTLAAHQRVRTRTEWLGRVDDARLEALYREADVLVSVSSFEGYGMALAEAVSAGLGVVSTNVGAVSEVLHHGEEALLVALGDEAALLRALTLVINDRALRERMQRCAAQRSFPRWEDTVESFARCLDGLRQAGG